MTYDDWENLLDENPVDSITRSAYADWLEEQGEIDLSFLQRWLGKYKIRPYKPGEGATSELDIKTWYGWFAPTSHNEKLAPWAVLPELVSKGLKNLHAFYDTRREAELALLPVLKKLKIELFGKDDKTS